MQIKLKILGQESTELERDADYVRLETAAGSIGILHGHAPLAARLVRSLVRYKMGDRQESFEISGGLAKVSSGSVTVFLL